MEKVNYIMKHGVVERVLEYHLCLVGGNYIGRDYYIEGVYIGDEVVYEGSFYRVVDVTEDIGIGWVLRVEGIPPRPKLPVLHHPIRVLKPE